MPKLTFSTMVIDGCKFEALVGPGGPKLEVSRNGRLVGSLPLGHTVLSHDPRRGADLQSLKGDIPSVRLQNLTTSGARAVAERYGLSHAKDSAAAFKSSPSWGELRNWVRSHPILAKRVSQVDHDLPGWHAAAAKAAQISFRPEESVTDEPEILTHVAGTLSYGDRMLVSDEADATVLKAMDGRSWREWIDGLDLSWTGLGMVRDFTIGSSPEGKRMAMDIRAEEEDDHAIVVCADMRLDADARTMAVHMDFACHSEVYPENGHYMAVAGACRMILGEMAHLARQMEPGPFRLLATPERFAEGDFHINSLEYALATEWDRMVGEDPDLRHVEVVVGRASPDGTPAPGYGLATVDLDEVGDSRIVRAIESVQQFAKAKNLKISLTPESRETKVESVPGHGLMVGRLQDPESKKALKYLESPALRKDLLELLLKAGLGKGDTVTLDEQYVGLVRKAQWTSDTWDFQGRDAPVIVHGPDLTEGRRALEATAFVHEWSYNFESGLRAARKAEAAREAPEPEGAPRP